MAKFKVGDNVKWNFGGGPMVVVEVDGTNYLCRDNKGQEVVYSEDKLVAANSRACNANIETLVSDLDKGKYDQLNWMPKVIGKGSLYPDGMKFPSGFGYDDEEKVRQAWTSGKYASVIVYKGGSKRGELTINSRACNSLRQGSRVKYVGDDPRWKGMTGVVLRVMDHSEDGYENSYWVDFPGRPNLPESELVANSRVCNSSNPVVRKAMNACAKNAAFDDGSVLVSYKIVGSSGDTQKRMTSRDFKTWLEKTGNGSKAQEIWYALMQGDEYSFLSGATRVRVKAL